jgi:hypothetical protein
VLACSERDRSMFRNRLSGSRWRAFVACSAAYALALNIILTGAFGAASANAKGGDQGAFETCLSHGGNPAAPIQPAEDNLHCVLCVTGVHTPVLPVPPSVTLAFTANPAVDVGPAEELAPPASARDPSKPTRGPPPAA